METKKLGGKTSRSNQVHAHIATHRNQIRDHHVTYNNPALTGGRHSSGAPAAHRNLGRSPACIRAQQLLHPTYFHWLHVKVALQTSQVEPVAQVVFQAKTMQRISSFPPTLQRQSAPGGWKKVEMQVRSIE